MTTTPSGRQLDRRRFIQFGTAAGLGLAAFTGCETAPARASNSGATAAARRSGNRGNAKNVIFMVSDGMSTGTLTLADMMIREREGRPSHWVKSWEAPGMRRSMCNTSSANSIVTDSAAAASAWGIGELVNNGAVNLTPDGREPTPILVTARENGKATGLVTSTRVTHATPAGFVARVPNRGMEDEIARQIVDARLDVVLGGGARHFPAELLDTDPDVTVVRTKEELERRRRENGRLLGLFMESHMSFELDRQRHEPHLREMTEVALERLARSPDGFIVQVEGGRVDHAAHGNDACGLLYDQIAFDEAIGVALDFTLARDDTLLIITSDHGNANPGMGVYGRDARAGFDRLMNANQSFEWIFDQLGRAGSEEEQMRVLPMLVYQATGAELIDDDRAWLYRRIVDKKRVVGFRAEQGRVSSTLGAVLANYLGVSFMSPNHTADYVEVTAVGPGAEAVKPFVNINELHAVMTGALDLRPVAG